MQSWKVIFWIYTIRNTSKIDNKYLTKGEKTVKGYFKKHMPHAQNTKPVFRKPQIALGAVGRTYEY